MLEDVYIGGREVVFYLILILVKVDYFVGHILLLIIFLSNLFSSPWSFLEKRFPSLCT
jgi:hypothetical protein